MDFSVNVGDLSSEFDLSKESIDNLLESTTAAVTEGFAREWDNAAKSSLGSTRDMYRSSIQVSSMDRFTGVVYLNPANWLPNAIEMGANAYDMKEGMLNSPNVKYGANGNPYLTVPFRFATPGSIGESALFSGVMPTEIHSAVKKQETTSTGGLKLGNIPKKYHIPKSTKLRKMTKTLKTIEKNSMQMTSIYEGLKRNSSGSGYVNFRRVSLNSEADSWQHPGFSARNLAEMAMTRYEGQIPRIIDVSIDDYLSSQGF